MAVDRSNRNDPNNPKSDATHGGTRHEDTTTQHEQGRSHPGNNPRNSNRGSSGFAGARMQMNSGIRNLGRPMGRTGAGQIAQDYHKKFTETFDQYLADQQKDYFRLLIMDQQAHNVALSAVLVVMALQEGNKNYISVYTMLIEGSAAHLPTRKVSVNAGNQRQDLEVQVTAGELFGDDLNNRVMDVLRQDGQPVDQDNTEVLDAGGTVIHREVDLDDEIRFRELAFEATNATFSEIRAALGFSQDDDTLFTVRTHIPQADQVIASIDITPEKSYQAETVTGLPVRDDINIQLYTEGSGDAIAFNNRDDISRVTSYVDLLFQPNPNFHNNPFLAQNNAQSQIPGQFLPRLVITDVQSMVDASSMEIFLMALSTEGLAMMNGNWARVFANRQYIPINEDMHDIGAIGYEVHFRDQDGNVTENGHYIDTKEQRFNEQVMEQFLTTFLKTDSLIPSIDIDESGPQSWITMAFDAASRGMVDAYNDIYEAADNLTNGCFSQIFQHGEAIVRPTYNKIHLGYYVDSRGNRRDLREIDTLYILKREGERGQQGMQTMADWERTFTDTSVDEVLRLHKRLEIIKRLVGEQVYVKGYATRVDLSPMFMAALAQAITNAGLQIQPFNLQHQLGAGVQRGYQGYDNWTISGSQMSTLFTSGYNGRFQNSGGFHNQQGYGGRWNR